MASSVDAITEGLYPMRVVARLSGLSADTIRAWERRYGAVVPERSAGNTRRFSAREVRRLILLREATQAGHAIGNIATLDLAGLQDLLGHSTQEPESGGSQPGAAVGGVAKVRDTYLEAVAAFDASRARDTLHRAAALLPPHDFVFEVVLPVLQTVGERWAHAEIGIAQEHLVSAQLRGLLTSLLRLHPSDRGAPRIAVTTPQDHRHEFGILVGSLLAAYRGVEVIYLGPDLPDAELRWVAEASDVKVMLLGIAMQMRPPEAERLAETLGAVATRCEVWLGTPPGHALVEAVPAARFFHGYEELDLALAELSRRPDRPRSTKRGA